MRYRSAVVVAPWAARRRVEDRGPLPGHTDPNERAAAIELARRRHELGRSFAFQRNLKLNNLGEPEGDIAYRREREIAREIERLGGWTREVRSGYRQARSELARKREP